MWEYFQRVMNFQFYSSSLVTMRSPLFHMKIPVHTIDCELFLFFFHAKKCDQYSILRSFTLFFPKKKKKFTQWMNLLDNKIPLGPTAKNWTFISANKNKKRIPVSTDSKQQNLIIEEMYVRLTNATTQIRIKR